MPVNLSYVNLIVRSAKEPRREKGKVFLSYTSQDKGNKIKQNYHSFHFRESSGICRNSEVKETTFSWEKQGRGNQGGGF